MGSHSDRFALYSLVLSDLYPYLSDGSVPGDPDGSFGQLPPDATRREFEAQALAKSIVKKFTGESDEHAEKAALDKFLACNSTCNNWELPDFSGFEGARDKALLTAFRSSLRWFFARSYATSQMAGRYPMFDWHSMLDWTKVSFFADVGPGKAVGVSGCSWIEKFDASPLTYSREFLWDLWNARARRSELSLLQEQDRESRLGHEQVASSKLLFVPKTVTEARTICIEPSLNMFFQKGVQALMENALKEHWGIDLKEQQVRNRELARIGSIDGSFGTIDLTSASDTISLRMLEWALDPADLSILKVLRTPCATPKGGQEVVLQMVSTMGNAFTFPLQTAIFAAAVEAVYHCRGIDMVKHGTKRTLGYHESVSHNLVRDVEILCANFAVNGDDIIVLTDAYDDTMRLLGLLGFKPNPLKSFNQGFFRESCGADWYAGAQVRGVYCKHLKHKQDFISLINRLNVWTARSGIPLTNTCTWLYNRAGKRVPLVPLHCGDAAGIRTPFDTAQPKRLCQSETNSKAPFYQQGHYYYEEFFFVPQALYVEGGSWHFSILGTVLSAIKGEIRSGTLIRREDSGCYRIRRLSTHRWDSTEEGTPVVDRCVRALTLALYVNLPKVFRRT